MEAKKTTKQNNAILSQAKKGVPGFALADGKFLEKTTLAQSSKGLITNYSRSLVPHPRPLSTQWRGEKGATPDQRR